MLGDKFPTYDLLVELTGGRRAASPISSPFGVELGGLDGCDGRSVIEVLYPSMQRVLRHGPFPFPVVLFFFTMENNEGWYTWVAEPVVSLGGGFEIVHCEASCRPLDSEAIDKIVEAVDRWYDAFFAKAIRETPSKKRN